MFLCTVYLDPHVAMETTPGPKGPMLPLANVPLNSVLTAGIIIYSPLWVTGDHPRPSSTGLAPLRDHLAAS